MQHKCPHLFYVSCGCPHLLKSTHIQQASAPLNNSYLHCGGPHLVLFNDYLCRATIGVHAILCILRLSAPLYIRRPHLLPTLRWSAHCSYSSMTSLQCNIGVRTIFYASCGCPHLFTSGVRASYLRCGGPHIVHIVTLRWSTHCSYSSMISLQCNIGVRTFFYASCGVPHFLKSTHIQQASAPLNNSYLHCGGPHLVLFNDYLCRATIGVHAILCILRFSDPLYIRRPRLLPTLRWSAHCSYSSMTSLQCNIGVRTIFVCILRLSAPLYIGRPRLLPTLRWSAHCSYSSMISLQCNIGVRTFFMHLAVVRTSLHQASAPLTYVAVVRTLFIYSSMISLQCKIGVRTIFLCLFRLSAPLYIRRPRLLPTLRWSAHCSYSSMITTVQHRCPHHCFMHLAVVRIFLQ